MTHPSSILPISTPASSNNHNHNHNKTIKHRTSPTSSPESLPSSGNRHLDNIGDSSSSSSFGIFTAINMSQSTPHHRSSSHNNRSTKYSISSGSSSVVTSIRSLIAFHRRLSLKQRLFMYFLLFQFFLLIVLLYFHLICPLLVILHQKLMTIGWLWPRSDPFPVNAAIGRATGESSKIAFVFTHPDDESMFYSPAIRRLLLQGHQIFMLCFTTNFKRFMKTPDENRASELQRAVRILGMEGRFKVLEPKDVSAGQEFAEITAIGQPGAHEDWFLTEDDMQLVLNKFVRQFGIDTVITFDQYGVSGHPEHFKARTAVLKYKETHPDLDVYELITYNKLIKFSGLVGSILFRGEGITLYSDGVEFAWNAMVEHKPQWVWFRKFFIANSRYAYVDNLRKIEL